VSRGEGELLTVPKPRAVSLLSVCLTATIWFAVFGCFCSLSDRRSVTLPGAARAHGGLAAACAQARPEEAGCMPARPGRRPAW
jgi:hypothetical protein